MIDLQQARINTAGAFVRIDGLYPFAIGSQLHNGRIPVYRLGGHREEGETGWQCALREAYEETGLKIRPQAPPATYLADGDRPEAEMQEIRWEQAAGEEIAPLLVASYQREASGDLYPQRLSLMYLAQADELPTPSAEVKGLLLLDAQAIHRLCREPLTLAGYLDGGGKAILNGDFDPGLVLEPFLQLRLLARILKLDPRL